MPGIYDVTDNDFFDNYSHFFVHTTEDNAEWYAENYSYRNEIQRLCYKKEDFDSLNPESRKKMVENERKNARLRIDYILNAR